MKVFKIAGMTAEETEELLSEAILLSRLAHPHIVKVFDANTTTTSKGISGFFTMEYVAGGTLDQFWRSHGAKLVPVGVTVEILRQCCMGLAIAHAETPPIVHRDIKPANILVGYDANGICVRISDFGLAKRVNPLTLMASTRGTKSFKPPETFRNQGDSCASDVWALGVTLYLLLTDRLPFEDSSALEVLDPVRFRTTLLPPSRLSIHVDSHLEKITLRALAHAPEDRYPDARAMLEDLAKWKPRRRGKDGVDAGASDMETKTALGVHRSANPDQAKEMIRRAFEVARKQGRLAEGADLMEEALNRAPDFREEYEYWVKIWRKGIAG